MTEKPNISLFIVGAAKSGTTSLYNYLAQHPDVFFPNVKEPNYYSVIDSEDPIDYRPPKEGMIYHNKIIRDKKVYFDLYKNSTNYKIVGDASPSYLWDKQSAKKIYADFPNAKIIIMLRNPINRTFSHYLMNIKSGIEKDSKFLNALRRDKHIFPKVWGDGKVLLYEELGMYYSQVQAYFDIFNPNNVKVLIYEEFFKNTLLGLKDLCSFLELKETEEFRHNTIHNKFQSPKSNFSKFLLRHRTKLNLIRQYSPEKMKQFVHKHILFKDSKKPEIEENATKYLEEVFKKDIDKLETLLNRNLDIWR